MTDKHPYLPSSGYIVQVLNQFRKSFPTSVTAATLKKLGFAPKNESYVLNVLRFLALIDEESNRTESAGKLFSMHDDSQFKQGFGKLLEKSYAGLFDLHGDDSWSLPADSLIAFFRTTDQSTALVGKLQATTFQVLAAFAGHGELPEKRARQPKTASQEVKRTQKKPVSDAQSKSMHSTAQITPPERRSKDVGLTVRIEINLPGDGDQETYNRIFKSIREYLLNE